MAVSKKEIDPVISRIRILKKFDVEELLEQSLPEDPDEALQLVINKSQQCKDCTLCTSRNTVSIPDGEASAPILIILESPGSNEDLTQIPLTGNLELKHSRCNTCLNVMRCFASKVQIGKRRPRIKKAVTCEPDFVVDEQITQKFSLYSTGSVFDGMLLTKYNKVFPRHNWVKYYKRETGEEFPFKSPFFITNSVLCRSWNPDTLSEVEPPGLSISTCKRWLALQYGIVNPKITILMGNIAVKAVLGKESIKKMRQGKIYDSKIGPVIWVPHPAKIMREQDRKRQALSYALLGKAFDKALKFCGLIVDGKLNPIINHENNHNQREEAAREGHDGLDVGSVSNQ